MGQADPAVGVAVQREVHAAGDALPSRYKCTWPALLAKLEAMERRQDVEAGVVTGSLLAAAALCEVRMLADSLPSMRKRLLQKGWKHLGDSRMQEELQARVMGVLADGVLVGAVKAKGRAVKASAAGIVGPTGFQNPEEKLRGGVRRWR